jgi:hypothetical protein
MEKSYLTTARNLRVLEGLLDNYSCGNISLIMFRIEGFSEIHLFASKTKALAKNDKPSITSIPAQNMNH